MARKKNPRKKTRKQAYGGKEGEELIKVPGFDKVITKDGRRVEIHVRGYSYARTGATDAYRGRQDKYMKGRIVHNYDPKRDKEIKAKQVRKPGEPAWRGDLKGKRV